MDRRAKDRLQIPEITAETSNCHWLEWKKSMFYWREKKIDPFRERTGSMFVTVYITYNFNKWGHQHTEPSLMHVFRLNYNSIITSKTGYYSIPTMLENAV